MREYEYTVDEGLTRGLSPSKSIPSGSQFLYDCLGFRCDKVGLLRHEVLSNPLPSSVDMYYEWPFPQFISGDAFNIMVIRDPINMEDVVYEVTDGHVVSLITGVDELTFGQGGLMRIADFGEYLIMTNGVIIIYYNLTTSDWTPGTATSTIPMMNTICNFKGQLFGGNVTGSWYDCDSKHYIWSKIGSADFTLEQDNEAGYKRCPYGGTVLDVLRLTDHVVGYSSEGITLFSPVNDPAPTFKVSELSDVGLLNKGAAAGSFQKQIYVNKDYRLMEVTGEGIKELDYQIYIKELVNGDVIVSYDRALKDFYISDGVKTFLLTKQGLTRVKQHPSTVWTIDGSSYMLPDTEDTDDSYITTWITDFNYRGQKTTFTVETDATDFEDGYALVQFLIDNLELSTDYSIINDQGISTIIVAGDAFRFKLKFETVNSDFAISYIKSRFKMTDLRGIRGVYAPPPRGQ